MSSAPPLVMHGKQFFTECTTRKLLCGQANRDLRLFRLCTTCIKSGESNWTTISSGHGVCRATVRRAVVEECRPSPSTHGCAAGAPSPKGRGDGRWNFQLKPVESRFSAYERPRPMVAALGRCSSRLCYSPDSASEATPPVRAPDERILSRSSAVIAGFSLRKARAFSLPWPR